MRKSKICLYVAIYAAAVIGLILGLAFSVGLTEWQALLISMLALLIFIAFIIIKLWLNRRRHSRRRHSRHRYNSQQHVRRVNSRSQVTSVRKKRLCIAGGTILAFLSILLLWNIYQKNVRSQIPDSLLTLQEMYPETSKFVLNYPKRKPFKEDIDLSGSIQPDNIPLFIQWDERWGYEEYGNDFLAVTGCGPTSISMVVCGLTGDTQWNPYKLAKFSEQQGYYVPGEGTSWSLMTEGAESLGLQADLGEVNAEYIKENLTNDSPIICSMYPGDFTYEGHFIVLTGVDSDGNIIVNDPNSKINSEKHWNMEILLPQIRSLWIYH